MGIVDELLRYLHVIFGFAGLAAFWVPVLSRKGGAQHVRFGRLFVWCAHIVLGSAGVTVLWRATELLRQGIGPTDRPASFAFLVLLGYLALVTWIDVRYAVGVLRTRRKPQALATPLNRALAGLAIAAGAAVVVYAIAYAPPNRWILLALSPVGVGIGYGILRYLRGLHTTPRRWLIEHLSAMLTAGIAFHTAFAVFGLYRLFDLKIGGLLAVLPWIAPTLIGTPAIVLWTRYYERRNVASPQGAPG